MCFVKGIGKGDDLFHDPDRYLRLEQLKQSRNSALTPAVGHIAVQMFI